MGRRVHDYTADTPEACAAKSCIEVSTYAWEGGSGLAQFRMKASVCSASDLDHFNVQNQQNLGKSPKYILTFY